MATLTFVNNTLFENGAVAQLAGVLAMHGIQRPLLEQ